MKKRCHAFRSYYAKSIVPGEIIDRNISAISEIDFETGNDFQQYFDSIQNIHALIAAIHKDVDKPVKSYEESDFPQEQIIIRIIKEMHDGSASYNEKVENYNTINPKNKIDLVDPIHFNSMNEVFQNLIVEVDNDKAKAA